MTDAEKNEALLKFAGFQFCFRNDDGVKIWYYPEPNSDPMPPPDLLHSLDAQAKWLWPKLEKPLNGQNIDDIILRLIRLGQMTAEACAEAILALTEAEKAVV